MGRKDGDSLQASQLLYPIMQAADIFLLQVDVCQLGLDQRKVNMLAREYAEKKGIKSPIILSHHMLPGLKKGQEKMSKSDPDSAIFMEDPPEEIARKIKGAYCPPRETQNNPVLEWLRWLVFINLPQVEVAGLTFSSADELAIAFANDKVSPQDLKATLITTLNQLLAPVRAHFEMNDDAKQLLERVRSYQVPISKQNKK